MEKRLSKTKSPCRIAITGPESTGKSLLAEALSHHYHTAWVSEYAREYLAHLGRPYRYEDIVEIARGQLAREEQQAMSATNYLFCDTDMLVTYVWSVFKFGHCDPWIEKQVHEHTYDYYLLCGIDLPWEPDPLREHPDQREKLLATYQGELDLRQRPYGLVRGFGEERTQCAIRLIDAHFGAPDAGTNQNSVI